MLDIKNENVGHFYDTPCSIPWMLSDDVGHRFKTNQTIATNISRFLCSLSDSYDVPDQLVPSLTVGPRDQLGGDSIQTLDDDNSGTTGTKSVRFSQKSKLGRTLSEFQNFWDLISGPEIFMTLTDLTFKFRMPISRQRIQIIRPDLHQNLS